MERTPTDYGPADRADIARKADKEDSITPITSFISTAVQHKLVTMGYTQGDWNIRLIHALDRLQDLEDKRELARIYK